MKGAVASGDLDKYKFVIERYIFPNDYDYRPHIIEDVIREAARIEVNEANVMQMVDFLIINKIPIGKYAVTTASAKGFYQVAEYLISHEAEKKSLTIYDLYSVYGDSQFPSFKWLLDRGHKTDKSLVGKILCYEKLWNMNKYKVFADAGVVEEAMDFLVEIGVTTREKITEVKLNCDIVVQAIQSYSGSNMVANHIMQGDPVSRIQFLLDNGAPLDNVIYNVISSKSATLEILGLLLDYGASLEEGGSIGYALVNYPNPEVVQYIIDEMTDREIGITAGYEDYPRYIVAAMSRYMGNCASNKIIADYAGLTDQVNWGQCNHAEL